MPPSGPVVSYHPMIQGDENQLLVSQRPLESKDRRLISAAAAVLLPQTCRPDLYRLVAGLGKPHFPRSALQQCLDGKVGNLRLFAALGLPHPRTVAFASLDEALAAWQNGELSKEELRPPLVAKGAGGGQGENVFLVHSPEELASLTERLDLRSNLGPWGMVLQEYLPTGGRDARVVLVGGWQDAFWRVAASGEFRANLSRGGRTVRGEDQESLNRCRILARRLAREASFDVAAVDFLRPPGRGPLLLEINFYFGREALGGTLAYWGIYLQSVRHWLQGLGLEPTRIQADLELPPPPG